MAKASSLTAKINRIATSKSRRPRTVSRDDVRDLLSVDMSDPNNSGWFRVTPELADYMLEHRSGLNRDLPPSYSEGELAEMMRDRKYEDYHPQGGQTDENGDLRDGRNRLKAIRSSGCTVIMWFSCGVTAGAIKTSDIGRTRTLGDRSDIELGKRAKTIAMRAFKYASQARPPRVPAYKKIDALEAFEQFCNDRAVGIERLESALPSHVAKVTRAPVLLALMEFFERHPEEASRFVEALLDKSQTLEPQAARVLKMELLRTLGGGWEINDRLYGNTVYCCKASLIDKKVTKMELGVWENDRLTKRKVKPKSKSGGNTTSQRPKDLPGQKRMTF